MLGLLCAHSEIAPEYSLTNSDISLKQSASMHTKLSTMIVLLSTAVYVASPAAVHYCAFSFGLPILIAIIALLLAASCIVLAMHIINSSTR